MSKILYYFSDYGANLIRKEQNLPGGVGHYRIFKPSEMIKGHEVTLWGRELTSKKETPEERWDRIFTEYDVFWCSYFSDPKEASACFYNRDKHKKKVVIDCDDNFLDVLESHPLYDKLKDGKRDKAFIATILSFADVITVSTVPLKQRLEKHFKERHNLEKKIIVIPNMNDIKEYNFPLPPKNEDKIVIGYAGSNSHQDDLAMFIPNLMQIMRKYKNVYFECIGSISKKDLHYFKDFTSDEMNRCDLLPATFTYKEYPEMLCNLKWDIAVAPLVDSSFARCKSHIKFMEMASIKTPIICSRVYPYFMDIGERTVVTDGVNGLLVKPSEWFNALEDLVLNKENRIMLGNNAYKHVVDNWQYDDSFSYLIDKVLN
jgi:glycosyltransferase involved in cell wall biosynthesis